MNEILEQGLKNLEMIGDSNHTSGLVSVQEAVNSIYSPEEFFALENAKKYKADFVYFRRFNNRPSIPQIYIYDLTNKIGVEEQELTHLHKQLYSSALVPMFFVFTKRDIRIFNCFERPSEGNDLKYKPLKVIKLASDVSKAINSKDQKEYEEFSAKTFDNGTFWESSKYSKQFKFSNSAYEKLLTELKQALRDIIKTKVLPADIARKVMVNSILVRYLEEREDEEGRKVFPSGFFSKFITKGEKFTDVFEKKGGYLDLLDFLAEHFNGGIFQVDHDDREFLKTADLSRFGLFLEGKAEGLQRVLWKLYSFNDLPVELISNIYEEFLGKQPGVVYTPPFLVNFLLNESMPLESKATDFKILDPACGSGVFLVGAYRRLIHRWRRNNGWERPSLATLKSLLKENIYGVELNKDAADLTIFSLSLALCDELTPLQIWEDLKFDNLHERNIIHDDFFNALLSGQLPNDFDLIIGNPPFVESTLTKSAKKIELTAFKNRVISINGKLQKVKLPRNQVALLFLEQSIKISKKGAITCLIQSAGPLLYNISSGNFRRFLLESYQVPQIVDFTHIARILFGPSGDVPTAAIFLVNEQPTKQGVLHITIRRTKAHKEKLFFELDSYDFHHVPRKLAVNDSYIWKSNYLGGSRFHQLTQKLLHLPRLKDFLKSKSWNYGAGIRIGNSEQNDRINYLKSLDDTMISDKEKKEFEQLKKKFIQFESLEKLKSIRFLPTEALTSNGIDFGQVTPFPYFFCENFKNTDVYLGPHILIKEGISNNKLIAEFTEVDLLFKEKIIGIQSSNKEELKAILKYLKSRYVSYYLAATSAEFLIRRSTSIKKHDVDGIPFDVQIDDHVSAFDKILIDDLFEYLVDFRSQGENSKILKHNVTSKQLQEYAEIYCEILSKVYPSIKPHDYFETNTYICYPFYFGENKPDIDFSNADEAERHLEALVRKNLNASLRLTRIVRMYEGNVIYLIKPRKLRYWLQSIALRDADETFTDLRKQGY
ncbi:N-6 DNA methylase [Marivirga tractuosa]|uniref:HsdM family class I SAM-dependent methyltransferase n=1 Tax=Marivirga tractuosa TaxID=1006 RepID=UPI0035CECBE0